MPHTIVNPDGDTVTYARISEEERAQLKYSSTESQIDDLRRWAEQQGWTVYAERWDEGYSATTMDRPELMEILTHDVENKNIRRVCIIEIGRLGGGVEWIPVMDRLRNKHGIEVLAHHDPIDASTPGGEFYLTLLLAAKRFQVRLTGQRIKDKIHSRAEKGLWHGGRCPPYFRVDYESTNLVPEMEYAPLVRQMHEEYIRSGSDVAVANWLDCHRIPAPRGMPKWDWHQVGRILRSSYYAGLIEHDGRFYEAAFEPLVAKELYEESLARRRSKNGSRTIVSENRVNLLIGIGRCGHIGCNASLTSAGSWKGNKRYFWYACSRKQRNYRHVDHSNRIRAEVLEKWVIDQLAFLSLSPEIIAAAYRARLTELNCKDEPLRDELRALDKARRKIATEMQSILDAIAGGSLSGALLTAVNDKFSTLEREHGKLAEREESLRGQIKHGALDRFDPEVFCSRLGDWSVLMSHATPEEKRELIRECVHTVWHDREVGNRLELYAEVTGVRAQAMFGVPGGT